jgi:hydroxymethylpyrimidine/phosphomethylpyrimidine kinase
MQQLINKGQTAVHNQQQQPHIHALLRDGQHSRVPVKGHHLSQNQPRCIYSSCSALLITKSIQAQLQHQQHAVNHQITPGTAAAAAVAAAAPHC